MQEHILQSAGEALKTETEVAVLTAGCSMRPMLREHRDLVIIKRVDRKFKKGDVVLYPGKDGKFILHRIMSIKKDRLIIRGDNNYFTEKHIKEQDIVGILKEFYRDGKYVNCETDFKYRVYVLYICHSYWIRFFWTRKGRPFLSKIKQKILKGKQNRLS